MIYDHIIRLAVDVDPDYPWINWCNYNYLDRISDGFSVINPACMEEFISDKICQHIGYTRKELGKTIADLSKFVVAEDFAQFQKFGAQIMRKEIDSIKCTKRLICKSGEIKTFQVKCTWDDNGNVVSVFTLLQL